MFQLSSPLCFVTLVIVITRLTIIITNITMSAFLGSGMLSDLNIPNTTGQRTLKLDIRRYA